MAQAHGLTWGTLDFVPLQPDPEGWSIEAISEGTTPGNPEAIMEIVKSLLTDGSLAILEGWDNREVVINFRASAPQGIAGPALAAAERAVMSHILAERKAPLIWTPPAQDAQPCVFDVVGATLERDFDDWDFDEVAREWRVWTLRLICLPFARTLEPVVVPALPTPPTVETHYEVDDCTSLTGWSLGAADGFGKVERTNLITNPALVGGPSGWSLTNPATGDLLGTQDGRVSNKIPNSTRDLLAVGPARPVTTGLSYVASPLLNYTRGGGIAPYVPGTFEVYIQWANSSGTVIGNSASATQTTPFTATSRVYSIGVAPAGATTGRVMIRCNDMQGDTSSPLRQKATAIFDNVILEQGSVPAGYFDGNSPAAGGLTHYWAGAANNSMSLAFGAPVLVVEDDAVRLRATATPGAQDRALSMVRTGAVSMADTPYLRVTAAALVSGGSGQIHVNWRIGTGFASLVNPVAITPSTVTGYVDYYFETGDFDRFELAIWSSGGAPNPVLSIEHIERTDTITQPGTTRERTRMTTVAGSAPTQATIRLGAVDNPLGTNALIYTSRSTFTPALRPFVVAASAITADTGRISGAYNTLADPMVINIPASELDPGTYALMAVLDTSSDDSIDWMVRMVSAGGTATIGSSVAQHDTTQIAATDGYDLVNIASVSLPVVPVEGDQKVEITLGGSAGITIDEVLAFNLDTGALTWVRNPDVEWIEVRSPEIAAHRPSVYGGVHDEMYERERGACIDWACESFGPHRFDPGPMQVFTVTPSTLGSYAELEFYPRYHSHVEAS